MVLDSRQYAIWQEMVRIFNIEPQTLDVTIPSLSPTIVPVVDVLNSVAPAFTRNNSIAAASPDSRPVATVPSDEYWHIQRMSVLRDSGDRTLNHVSFEAPIGGAGRCFLSLTNVNSAGRGVIDIPVSLLVPPGTMFMINDSGGTTDSGWTLVMYRRELPISV